MFDVVLCRDAEGVVTNHSEHVPEAGRPGLLYGFAAPCVRVCLCADTAAVGDSARRHRDSDSRLTYTVALTPRDPTETPGGRTTPQGIRVQSNYDAAVPRLAAAATNMAALPLWPGGHQRPTANSPLVRLLSASHWRPTSLSRNTANNTTPCCIIRRVPYVNVLYHCVILANSRVCASRCLEIRAVSCLSLCTALPVPARALWTLKEEVCKYQWQSTSPSRAIKSTGHAPLLHM